MKRIIALLVLVTAIGCGLTMGRADAADNLIINPSMETAASGSLPANWSTDKWGTNSTTFSYPSMDAHSGSRSVRVQTTSYTSGDAKWVHKPVAVTAGQAYTFSNFYRANVATKLVVRYTHTGGSYTYAYLGEVPANNVGWATTSASFTAPATATHATVFHLISSVGWLLIDDANLVTVPPPTPTGPNLVANPSAEQAASGNPSQPDKWLTGQWGANTATHTYASEGHTGTRSLKVEITAYTDGDTKWYYDPVNVSPATTYETSDYYKANVPTQVFVRYTKTDNSFAYEWLGSLTASTAWKQGAFTFTTPADAKQATVFHLVNSIGWLQIDSTSLVKATATNPIPNPSLEQVSTDPSKPANWQSSKWGTNTATFNYMNEGRTGSRSVKVAVSNYVDGDAKWYYNPQVLVPGKTYRFSVWYKTNTTPQLAIMHQRADGSAFYAGLPAPTPTGSTTQWQPYADTFTVPVDAARTSVFLYVAGNGWVQTDDYMLEEYQPVGFSRPLVTLTFDDGEEDNVSTALPVMNSYGFKSTQCFATDHVEGDATNSARVLAFRDSGHEICSHTVTHPFLSQVPATQLAHELTHSRDFLRTLTGKNIDNFASPYGDYNTAVLNAIQPLYRSHRTVDAGYNSKDNFNIYKVRVQNMLSTTTLQEYQSWLDYAEATNTWLVLVYHRVASSNTGPYDTNTTDFGQQMAALNTSGVIVKTYNDALDELVPQL